MIGFTLYGIAVAVVQPSFSIPAHWVRNILKGFAVLITGGFGNVKGTVVATYFLEIIERACVFRNSLFQVRYS